MSIDYRPPCLHIVLAHCFVMRSSAASWTLACTEERGGAATEITISGQGILILISLIQVRPATSNFSRISREKKFIKRTKLGIMRRKLPILHCMYVI